MYNRRYIIPGLLVFIVLFSAPFWANALSSSKKPYKRPELALPANATECVEPAEYMRAEHMRILNEWRDAALRDGKRLYKSSTGTVWEVSLQNTCMKCHNDKANFCDACHTSNSVDPYCWTCHIEPKKPAAQKSVTPKLAGGG